ncbi:MAG: TolC family protein [Muribaculaceae bacterium]|nr:TolC family protein [Muribaculaceae bacterium]
MLGWEFDAFGKILNSKRGAEASYAQSKDYEQAVRSQIISGVANLYYAISSLEAQVELTRETSMVWKSNVETMKEYKESGRTNEAGVAQSEANYYNICASLNDLEISLNEAMNSFSLILGEMPHAWDIAPGLALELPAAVSDGVPMVELANRPDVRAAERSLAVAYYATNSARAAFYPSINLTANLGFTNSVGGMIHNPAVWFTQLAASLTAPIFQRGQNIARLKATKAQQEQTLNTFRYTLMSAAADVHNAIDSYDRNSDKAQWLGRQVEAWQRSVDATTELFKYTDTTTYLELLTAQSGLLSAQMGVISCDLARTQAVISLYQSLGGGGIAGI